jgi:cell division protein FtsI (penicillin-binding protein 3)
MFQSFRTHRIRFLAIAIAVCMMLFVARLLYLQVIRHDYYAMQANSEQMRQWKLPAVRGEIYSLDNGTPRKLVLNETVYTVWADPKVVTNPDKVVTVLQKIAGGNVRKDIASLLQKKDTRYQILATKISTKQAQMIKQEKLYGLGFERGEQRVYPEGQLGSQVLGFVNGEGKGQYGLEEGLDTRLQGTDGMLKTVADVRDVPLTLGKDNITVPAKNGENIVMSIDRSVQAYVEKALADGLSRTGAKTGSVVVMDPRSGQVMAMANMPTYDPRKLSEVSDVAAFNNDTISMPYEAGSDIKTFTVAMGLDTGVIQPNSTYVNTDYIQVDDRTIANALKGHTGTITMQDALNYSLNTGMVTIVQRLGNGSQITDKSRSTMYEYFHDRLRLGQLTGIELAHESAGTVIPPTSAEGNAVRYSNMSFGQGMDVTMLQVSAGFCAIVNGGTYYQPTIVAGTMQDGVYKQTNASKSYPHVISTEASSQAREMVHRARTDFHKNIDTIGYYIGGKTGTSQTLRNGQYVSNETIATYLGFGGAIDEPSRYVIMVEVAGPGMNLEGNIHAMPIFTDISNWLLRYLQLSPKG